MPPLRQARHAILPAAALAAAGVTIWLDVLGGDVERDDLCPAVLTIILSCAAILDFSFRRFWKRAWDLRLTVLAEGVSAAMREQARGDGQDPTGGRPAGGASSQRPQRP